MKCVNHSEADASGVCVNCGKSFCAACVVQLGGTYYCKPDFEKLAAVHVGVEQS
jgi:hypothetical protein